MPRANKEASLSPRHMLLAGIGLATNSTQTQFTLYLPTLFPAASFGLVFICVHLRSSVVRLGGTVDENRSGVPLALAVPPRRERIQIA